MQYCPQLCGHVPFRDNTMRTSHPDIWVAGDASGIEEASAAMVRQDSGFSAAKALGCKVKRRILQRILDKTRPSRAGEVGEKIRGGSVRYLLTDGGIKMGCTCNSNDKEKLFCSGVLVENRPVRSYPAGSMENKKGGYVIIECRSASPATLRRPAARRERSSPSRTSTTFRR
jgi:hypothetical protein